MQTNANGEELHKRVTFKIFSPGNRFHRSFVMRAAAGSGFNPEQIETLVERVAGHVEKEFPAHEYSLVPLGPAAFNFVCQGERCAEPDFDAQLEEERLSETGAAQVPGSLGEGDMKTGSLGI